MLRIEFLGSPYSGKSFIKSDIKKTFICKKYNFYSYRNFFNHHLNKYQKLNIIDQLIFNSINLKETNKLSKNQNDSIYLFKYLKLIVEGLSTRRILLLKKNIYKNFSKENQELTKLIKLFFKKNSFKKLRKNELERWFVEICTSYFIFTKLKSPYVAILDSEGFIHRLNSFIINNYDESFINDYLEVAPKPNILIYIDEKYQICRKRLINENLNQNIIKYKDTLETYSINSELIYNKIKNKNLKIFRVNSENYYEEKHKILKYINEN